MFIFDSSLSLSVFNHLPKPVDNLLFFCSVLCNCLNISHGSGHNLILSHILSKTKTVSDICNNFSNFQIPLFSKTKILPFIDPKIFPQAKSSP